MVKALLALGALVFRSELFELVGATAIVAGVYGLAGGWWALVATGVLCLLKSFDLALAQGR